MFNLTIYPLTMMTPAPANCILTHFSWSAACLDVANHIRCSSFMTVECFFVCQLVGNFHRIKSNLTQNRPVIRWWAIELLTHSLCALSWNGKNFSEWKTITILTYTKRVHCECLPNNDRVSYTRSAATFPSLLSNAVSNKRCAFNLRIFGLHAARHTTTRKRYVHFILSTCMRLWSMANVNRAHTLARMCSLHARIHHTQTLTHTMRWCHCGVGECMVYSFQWIFYSFMPYKVERAYLFQFHMLTSGM